MNRVKNNESEDKARELPDIFSNKSIQFKIKQFRTRQHGNRNSLDVGAGADLISGESYENMRLRLNQNATKSLNVLKHKNMGYLSNFGKSQHNR